MTIEQRIERLEQHNRRLKVAVSVLVLAMLGGVLLAGPLSPKQANAQATTTPRVVEANEFRLVGKNGKARARLSMVQGQPNLSFSDENGKSRVGLGTDKEGTGIAFYDENGNFRAGLGVVKAGPNLAFYDKNGKSRVEFVAGKDGPKLVFLDENGKLRAALGVINDGARLRLVDENEKPRVVLGKTLTETRDGKTITYPESSLLLFDDEGAVIWSAP